MSDHDRTVAAAVEAITAAILLAVGLVLTGVLGVIAIVLIAFGVSGLAHAVLFGLGLISPPGHSDTEQGKHGRTPSRANTGVDPRVDV